MTDEHIQRVVQQAIGTELAYGVNSLARELDWQSKVRDAYRTENDALKAQRDELLRALQDLLHYHIGAQKDGEFSTIAAARAAVARCKEAK